LHLSAVVAAEKKKKRALAVRALFSTFAVATEKKALATCPFALVWDCERSPYKRVRSADYSTAIGGCSRRPIDATSVCSDGEYIEGPN
jgi:hypothetical protein